MFDRSIIKMRGWLQHRWTSLYLLVLSLFSLALFLYGFFPLKVHSGRFSSWADLPKFIRNVSIDRQEVYNAGETSVVLMVIDALRCDFLSEETMPFTTELLKNKTACHYVAVAESPTVTLPRIKAMMTGSVSTFADVALNLGAPAVAGDSVVRGAAVRGRRTVVYGDVTWLRLFPGLWDLSDFTYSFYMSDYTQVDTNVTRHLDKILLANEHKQPPFDFLVLHYAGLDHIGHLEGARSPKIAPKLKQMDDVVRKIFTAMGTWDRAGALMVCSDHGMRDEGGHGGVTPAEILVPLVLARTGDFKCPHVERPGPLVAQTDVAPSIAYLLRTPLPADSTGRLLSALLPADPREHLYLLHYNARENARALADTLGEHVAHEKECYKQFRRAEDQFAQYLVTGQAGAARLAREYYQESLDVMAKYLAESTVHFDMFAITLSILLLLMMLAGACVVTLHSLQRGERSYRVAHDSRHRTAAGEVRAYSILLLISAALTLACAVTETKSNVCHISVNWTPIALAAVAAVTYAFFIIKTGTKKFIDTSIFTELNCIDCLLITGTAVNSITFVGTSFIDEEHQTWYYAWNTLMLCVLVRPAGVVVSYVDRWRTGATELQDKPAMRAAASTLSSKLLPCWLLLIGLHRFLRTMNQTGDHWAFLPDTADWLNEPDNAIYLQAFMLFGMGLTLLICVWNLQHTNNTFQMNTALTIVASACVAALAAYRVATASLPPLHPSMTRWDTVHIVNVLWGVLVSQFVFECLTFVGAYRQCCHNTLCSHEPTYEPYRSDEGNSFVYRRRKEKSEVLEEDALSAEDVKLKFARSLSHVMLNTLMLIACLLMRPHNVILVPSVYVTCVLTSRCIRRTLLPVARARASDTSDRPLDVLSQALAHYWIGCVFFFYQGNSNSLASVDLSAGYVGLREYCPVRVALRLGLHTYAAPALSGMTLLCTLAQLNTWTEYKRTVWICMNILSLLRVYSQAVYACVAVGFRYHPFIWSVFSPKLLYDFAATVFSVAAMLTIAAIFGVVHVTHRAANYIALRSP